ncbi:hypothetical protein [Mycobacterium sp.]|uniref:hypothetical protein n=1 Tax=Mycobacterium sp. TaxID=1785 RepID=UPI003F97EA2C
MDEHAVGDPAQPQRDLVGILERFVDHAADPEQAQRNPVGELPDHQPRLAVERRAVEVNHPVALVDPVAVDGDGDDGEGVTPVRRGRRPGLDGVPPHTAGDDVGDGVHVVGQLGVADVLAVRDDVGPHRVRSDQPGIAELHLCLGECRLSLEVLVDGAGDEGGVLDLDQVEPHRPGVGLIGDGQLHPDGVDAVRDGPGAAQVGEAGVVNARKVGAVGVGGPVRVGDRGDDLLVDLDVG